MIEIYTDGACLGNPGPGGWAAVVVEDGSKRILKGREEHTTNNRMEMMAVIKGLESMEKSAEVTIFSDSQYVVNTMVRHWNRRANLDLWTRLDDAVAKRRVKWQWVRGHVGNTLNEEANDLASHQANANRGEVFGGTTFTHINEFGRAEMVDIGSKIETQRVAMARGSIVMRPEAITLIKDNGLEKGDVIGVARVAGIMAAKSTSGLIPLCHSIPIDQVDLEFQIDEARCAVDIVAIAKTVAKTGVEMEAMMAVSIAALTIYDMCKGVDRTAHIEGIRMVSKSGGKSGDIHLET